MAATHSVSLAIESKYIKVINLLLIVYCDDVAIWSQSATSCASCCAITGLLTIVCWLCWLCVCVLTFELSCCRQSTKGLQVPYLQAPPSSNRQANLRQCVATSKQIEHVTSLIILVIHHNAVQFKYQICEARELVMWKLKRLRLHNLATSACSLNSEGSPSSPAWANFLQSRDSNMTRALHIKRSSWILIGFFTGFKGFSYLQFLPQCVRWGSKW